MDLDFVPVKFETCRKTACRCSTFKIILSEFLVQNDPYPGLSKKSKPGLFLGQHISHQGDTLGIRRLDIYEVVANTVFFHLHVSNSLIIHFYILY